MSEERRWASRKAVPTRLERPQGHRPASRSAARGGMLTALLGLLSTVAVADELRPPPFVEDYLVEWYQPHDLAADGEWEIEVKSFRKEIPTTIERADAAPVDSCWALEVPTSEAALVRIREADSQTEWSRYTAVPEPASAGAIGAAVVLAAAHTAHRRRRESGRSARRREPVVTSRPRMPLLRDPEAKAS